MSNLELIGRYRNRLVAAKLDSLQRNTGSTCVIKRSPKGMVQTIELTTEVLTRALEMFELVIIESLGKTKARESIVETYKDCVKKFGGLTQSGHALVDRLIDGFVTASDEPATGDIREVK
ncbi:MULTISPECIES: hypothetical protein [Yersinia]|uniref:Uncharacterized protein n=1 Tax=Yersinia frederiksenii TaxID=29484 RepID=A0AAI9ENH2_YERFR|nr:MULTISPECIES: hypothetical protein [Yersinia]CNK57649.1 Uncharacterised protein [Yersinia intermedia]ATM87038.1 hypothetical protein CRN74_13700 [Yersinia frederiksenii]MCB5320367.1 hypothetical protein [Yersinia massiliensis]MDN0128847.1 hypothetical protein [Yersinia massiliensis]CFR04413.1 Uncharacterised protein [Yersinia frederiksenii]